MKNDLADFYQLPRDGGCLSAEPGSDRAALRRTVQPAEGTDDVDHYLYERYAVRSERGVLASGMARRIYYGLRPMLNNSVRRQLQRLYFRSWEKLDFPRWPVDTTVEDLRERRLLAAMRAAQVKETPFIWFWPDGAPAAAIMTHDVETEDGLARVADLMDVDDEFGVKAAFQLVPVGRYKAPKTLLDAIRKREFEVNVHGLDHEGDLFAERAEFLQKAERINGYIREFESAGFRSPCMYRNAAWLDALDISYDMSAPNVAHLEPQQGGCCTVFPHYIGEIVELPLTAVQDYSLFHILGDYSIDLWKMQMSLIMARHGLMSFIVHPDYVFADEALPVFRALLSHLAQLRDTQGVWIARPAEINRWWRDRSEMSLSCERGMWRISGPNKERARIGFASIENGEIVYTIGKSFEATADESKEHVFSSTNDGSRAVGARGRAF